MKPGQRGNRARKSVYLLPSLFTFGNMLLGFYAFVLALRGNFETAAILIFVAGILDSFDGRIARMTGTESAFGGEFDSLADALTFGAIPAMLAHIWGLQSYGRIGWLIPVFYLLCAATRLARFNVQSRTVDSRFFVGLPTPPAAATVASLLYFATPHSTWDFVPALMMGTLIATGILMVSTFRYRSFKQFDLSRPWTYRTLAIMAGLVLLIVYNPPVVFFTTAIVYTLSGPVEWLIRRLWRLTLKSDSEEDGKRAPR
jgi:CDP-diacylglycerol--serine O-phosphatidyltransferase